MGKQHRYQGSHWFKRGIQQLLLPLLLGIVATIAVLGLWRQLVVEEYRHTEQLVQQQANLIQVELRRNLTTHVSTLERMAKRWAVAGGTSKTLWEASAASNIEDFPGLQAIAWIDPTFQVQWVVPQSEKARFQDPNLRQVSHFQSTLNEARKLRQLRLTPTILFSNGESGLLAVAPLFAAAQANGRGDRFDGFILGFLSSQTLFDSVLPPASRYQIQISDDIGVIYQQSDNRPLAPLKTMTLQAYGQVWQVKIALTSLIYEERSHVPKLLLWSGLGGAWTLALVVYLGQQARRQSRRMRRINQQLQNEIIRRQQVEASLRESEERWQLALRGNNDGIWDWNVRTNEVFFSSRWKEMLGFEDHEIANNLDEWSKRVHPDDLGWVTEIIQDHFARKTPFYISEHRVQCKDGSYKWILDRGQALWDEAGHVIRMTGSYTDIGRRKQSEIDLQNSQARFAGILEIASDAIISVNTNQQITLFNKGAERIFGYTAEEVLDQPLALLIPDRFAQAHGHHVNQYAHTANQARQMAQRSAIFGRRKDGTEFPAEASISKLTLNGEITFTAFLRDISERVTLETKRQQSEEALRESEARFQSFMYHSPAAAWISDDEGKISYLSQTYLRTFQIPDGDFVGKTIFDLFSADIAQALLDNIQTVARTQQVLEAIEFAPRQDGTLGTFLVYKFPIPNALGQTLIGGVAIDITQQRHVEEALRQSEATKHAIIQAIPDLLIRMRADGSYVEFISNTQFNIFNPIQHRENVSVYDVLPPDLAQFRMCQTQQALQSGSTQVYEHEIWIEGKQSYEEVRIVPLLDDEVLVMVRDITDRKQAETELKHQKDILQTIVNHIPVMIALFNTEGRIEFVNPEFERVLGWPLEDWQRKNVLLECYPDPAYYKTVLEHMVAVNGSWKDFTTLTKTGQAIETSWANVQLSNGSNLGIGQDVSDRKHKEAILQQAMEASEAANTAKSMFLANMSHELRTPLNVILGFAQVMGHDSSLTPAQLEDLQTIQRSGDHLLSLINDVLDLSKIEAGHFTLEESGFDLISLLHMLRTMMAERSKEKQLQLTFEIAPEVPQFVIADEQKLRQILLNLLSNAIRFTKQGSVTLQVTSWESSKNMGLMPHSSQNGDFPKHVISSDACILQFEIADTGVGIAAKEQEAIFDAFMQAEAGRKLMGGTGLGLTISRKLLELMNGRISVDSTPGVGSTFTVMVPVRPTSDVNGQSEHQKRTIIGLVPGHSHRRILVVDDQPENRMVVVRLLTHLGLDVQEATNGQEAIALWQNWKPDLTWMDIRMPVLDGYEATKRIRALEHEQSSIIIALTAQASQSDRTLALAAGCNDYISKPFREETLFLKLKEHLGLEYLYAEEALESSPFPSGDTVDQLGFLDPAMLTQIPADWLETLEDLALCGNDRAIVKLAAQLPPEFETFATQLVDLANRFEFEQIVRLIHRGSA